MDMDIDITIETMEIVIWISKICQSVRRSGYWNDLNSSKFEIVKADQAKRCPEQGLCGLP